MAASRLRKLLLSLRNIIRFRHENRKNHEFDYFLHVLPISAIFVGVFFFTCFLAQSSKPEVVTLFFTRMLSQIILLRTLIVTKVADKYVGLLMVLDNVVQYVSDFYFTIWTICLH